MTNIVVNTWQKVRVVYLSKEDSISIKLTKPTDPTSPVHTFAMRGGGLHHLCFRCAEVDAEVKRLKALGLRILAEPQPGEAFDYERIAFVYAKHGLNIEIIDTEERAERVDSQP